MDPNQWRNFNPSYSHLGPGGGLASSSANLNRFDLPLLTADQTGLNTGLGATLPPHATAGRSLGGLAGVPASYPLQLHNSVPQYLDAVSPLQSPLGGQNPYKSLQVGQLPFSIESSGLRSADGSNPYGLPPHLTADPGRSKTLFGHEQLKDTVGNYAITPSQQTLNERSQKGWGLSNFVQSQGNLFGTDLTMSTASGSVGPPPAHSGATVSRNSTIQRNPLSADLYQQIHVSTAGKLLGATSSAYSVPSTKSSEVSLSSPTNALLSNYGLSEHGIEDLTKSQSHHTQYGSFPSSLPVKSESSYQASSIVSNMNYDPVSPVSDPGQPNDNFSAVDLQDFSQLNPVNHPLKMDMQSQKQQQDRVIIQDTHHLLLQSNIHKSESQQNLPQELEHVRNSLHSSNMTTNIMKNQNNNPLIQAQNMHSTHSPLHQQTVQTSSPHVPMQMGSPQGQLPSSTVVSTPTPVQAVPDSTTKPKKPRGRKKKDQNTLKEQARQNEKLYQEVLQASSLASQSLMSAPPQGGTPASRVMSMGGSYSPHTTYPYSPQKKQTTSPQTPQSYSPQMVPQSMMDGSYGAAIQSHSTSQKNVPSSPLLNNNQQRNIPSSPLVNNTPHSNLLNEQFSLQHSSNIVNANLSSGDHMSLAVSSCSVSAALNQVPVISDSIIRGGAGRNIQPQTILQTSVSQHSPVNPSPPVQMSVNSMQNNPPPLMVSNPNFTYGQPSQSQSFVDQLQSSADIDMDKAAIEDPLGMQALVLAEGDSYTVQNPQGALYPEIDGYGNHFENQGPTMGYGESPVLHRSTSTIDEDALSSLIGPSPSSARDNMMPSIDNTDESPDRWQNSAKMQQKYAPPLAITTQPEIDDEFAHLRNSPLNEKAKPKVHKYDTLPPPSLVHNPSNIPHQPHPMPKSDMKKNPSSGFMDSFLSFIQGKKPETLSSVNSAVVKRPELPKYIPEPPRKRPLESVESKTSSDSAASTPKQDNENSSNMGLNSPCTSHNDSTAYSDEEDSKSYISSTVQNVAELNKDGKPSLKVKISLSKGKTNMSGKVKSSETKVKFPKKKSPRSSGKSHRSSSNSQLKYHDNEFGNSSGDEEYQIDSEEKEMESDEKVSHEPSPPIPRRQMSSRRAKEKAQESKKYVESDSDDETLNPIVPAKKRPLPELEAYDSDQDPEWAPFAVENRRQSYDGDYMPKRAKRTKGRKRSSTSRKSVDYEDTLPSPKLNKHVKLTPKPQPVAISVTDMRNQTTVSSGAEKSTVLPPISTQYKPGYRVGDYLIDNKDLNKYECFPIWKIETGRMMKKYELVSELGKIRHRSLCTFSSWMPSMEKDYTPIRAKVVTYLKDCEIVEVYEDDRPKPKLDSKLENAYEADPLAEMFNVYLQIFLSQALEPGFLSAILESRDKFYLAPLNGIDKIIDKKLQEIEAKVRWRQQFKDGLKAKPHIRELDRPNLKQACHACEDNSQPAIKSVHLFGQSYDHATLEEDKKDPADIGSMEFMIGKTAATYVGPYHNLYHFKFNLAKRCFAKVNIVRQGNKNLDNAEILDRCLNNRIWVLKIFDDLKNMLDKG